VTDSFHGTLRFSAVDLFHKGTKIKCVPMLLLSWMAGKNGFVTPVQIQSHLPLQTVVLCCSRTSWVKPHGIS